jgi:hypothetical protein
VVSTQEAERAIGVNSTIPAAVPSVVPTEVLTDVPSEAVTATHTEVLAPILRNRKKKERLLSWTVRLPESLKSHLERASKKYDIEMSAIVVAGTRDYLDRYFPE